MSGNIWFTSDSHFNHANILKFTDWDGVTPIRPGFKDAEHMNETMIENWNKVVKPQDKIYHLGDISFGREADFQKIAYRLNGSKRLLLGNHDKFDILVYAEHFKNIGVTRSFTEFGKAFICSHYPIQSASVSMSKHERVWNVHGHIHQNTVCIGNSKHPDPMYVNVCVEKTNYTPVHLDDLLARMK